jgi:hypothetical protein
MARIVLAAILASTAALAIENPIYIDSGAIRGRGKDIQVFRGIVWLTARWRASLETDNAAAQVDRRPRRDHAGSHVRANPPECEPGRHE